MSNDSYQWKSINKIMVEVSIPETTARRYLSRFQEFFHLKEDKKGKLYRDDTGEILRKIAALYDMKYSTEQVKAILRGESVNAPAVYESHHKNGEPNSKVVHEYTLSRGNHVSIETLSQQNLLIMATLKELTASINQISNQQLEIAQLKREIQELRLQLVSLSPSYSTSVVRTSSPWKPQEPDEIYDYADISTSDSSIQVDEESESELEPDFDPEPDIEPALDEEQPTEIREPIELPVGVDRQQLADIIAELRANEVKQESDDNVAELSPAEEDSADIPMTEQTISGNMSREETSILLDMSYVPPASPHDLSNLSRVHSRSQSRTRLDEKKWWQFWK